MQDVQHPHHAYHADESLAKPAAGSRATWRCRRELIDRRDGSSYWQIVPGRWVQNCCAASERETRLAHSYSRVAVPRTAVDQGATVATQEDTQTIIPCPSPLPNTREHLSVVHTVLQEDISNTV